MQIQLYGNHGSEREYNDIDCPHPIRLGSAAMDAGGGGGGGLIMASL
jgi:hypothetical protein